MNGALDHYGQHGIPAFAWLVEEKRPDVIKVFFQDAPEALALLKKQGVLE